MKKILINFAHPAKSKSKINIALRDAIADLDNITINDLYANYPDFMIDIKREQKLCETNDIIIFQHPFYWYQAPSIVKEWMDLVLEHSWAYGSKGNALKGKLFMQVITAGGDELSYQPDGLNLHTISELCSPFRATANLCKMEWIPPFSVLGIHRGLSESDMLIHETNYVRFINALQKECIDFNKAREVQYCSKNLDSILLER